MEAPGRFKAISEAYEVLKDDAKRAMAAAEASEAGRGPFHRDGGGSGFSRTTAASAAQREQARAMHRTLEWFELLVHPRVLLSIVAFSMAATFLFNAATLERRDPGDLVQAWHNPRTCRWEVPAPWDPAYRALRPEVKMIARSLVHEPSTR